MLFSHNSPIHKISTLVFATVALQGLKGGGLLRRWVPMRNRRVFFEKKQMLQSILFLSGQILCTSSQPGWRWLLAASVIDWHVTETASSPGLKEDAKCHLMQVLQFLQNNQRWQRPVYTVTIPSPCFTLQPSDAMVGASITWGRSNPWNGREKN